MAANFSAASSQWLDIDDGSQTGLDFTGNILSFECWVKLSQLTSTYGTNYHLMSKFQATGNNRSYRVLLTTSDTLYVQFCEFGTTTQAVVFTTNSAILSAGDLGSWVHIAVTLNSTTPACTIYKNGSTQANTKTGGTDNAIYNGTASFGLGARTDGASTGSQFYDGKMAYAAMFSDIRTSGEITTSLTTPLTSSEGNIQGLWTLISNANDSSSNSNNLTNNNSVTFDADTPYATAEIKDIIGQGFIPFAR